MISNPSAPLAAACNDSSSVSGKFDVPGDTNSTNPVGINRAGEITGSYSDANNVTHGFLRSRGGAFTTFDVPGAIATVPTGLNSKGVITGYDLANNRNHGFLRYRDGTFITFDPPGAVDTDPTSINSAGAITGYYQEPAGVYHGFLRIEDKDEEDEEGDND